jgi:hypothetical protein
MILVYIALAFGIAGICVYIGEKADIPALRTASMVIMIATAIIALIVAGGGGSSITLRAP